MRRLVGDPALHRPRAERDPAVPDDWSLVRYRAVDEANRVIIDGQVQVLSDNTPVGCVEHCVAAGYDYAGVDYGG